MASDIDGRMPATSSPFLLQTTLADFLEILFLKSVCENTFIASPSGIVQKFFLKKFFDVHAYAGFWMENIEGLDAELPPHFVEAYELKSKRIDEATAKYRPELRVFETEFGLLNYYRRLPLFHERMAFTVSLEVFDWVSQNSPLLAGSLIHAARIFRPFEGWAMCVSEEYAQTEWKNFMQADRMGLVISTVLQDNDRNGGRGRPPTAKISALSAYRELYPGGHANLTWKDVLRAIQTKTGITVSRDTLKRALASDA